MHSRNYGFSDPVEIEPRENRVVNVGERGERPELTAEPLCHRVERRGELAEFVVAGNFDARGEIAVRGSPRPSDELFERSERPANLGNTQQRYH